MLGLPFKTVGRLLSRSAKKERKKENGLRRDAKRQQSGEKPKNGKKPIEPKALQNAIKHTKSKNLRFTSLVLRIVGHVIDLIEALIKAIIIFILSHFVLFGIIILLVVVIVGALLSVDSPDGN